MIGDHVGRAAAIDGADIQRAAAEQGVLRQRNLANVVENIEQRVDGGMTEFGIGRVRQLSVSRDFVAQRAFRTEGETVLGGLAIDEESRATGSCGGGFCSGAVAFFAHDKQQPKISRARGEQFLRGGDHRRDDPLRVAGTAAPNEIAIFARTKKGRNGIHVRGERDDGLTPGGEDIVAIGFGGDTLDAAIVARS